MFNPFDFSGKNILITGGADGIGKVIAIQLVEAGAKLIVVDNDANKLEKLRTLLGDNHLTRQFDLANIGGLASELDDISSFIGPFDGIVHCVGLRSRRPVKLLHPEEINRIMSINFGSFIEIVRLITRKNKFNQGLSIVGISSIAAQRGGPGVTAYAASKAAMDAAVRCLAKELANKKIRLNTVVPAQIDTPAFRQLMEMSGSADDPTLSRQYLGLGRPENVAHAVMFLLSNVSDFISGIALPVDGGFLSS